MGSNRAPSDTLLDTVARTLPPITLPMQTFGPTPIVWHDEPIPVWAWISWPHRATERIPAYVIGSNDRVCIVEIQPDTWSRWQPVVWRAAVTRRATTTP